MFQFFSYQVTNSQGDAAKMPFLSIAQAAEQFGLSAESLRMVAKAGKLPGARKIGGRWFVSSDVLKRYFEGAMPAPAEQPAARMRA